MRTQVVFTAVMYWVQGILRKWRLVVRDRLGCRKPSPNKGCFFSEERMRAAVIEGRTGKRLDGVSLLESSVWGWAEKPCLTGPA